MTNPVFYIQQCTYISDAIDYIIKDIKQKDSNINSINIFLPDHKIGQDLQQNMCSKQLTNDFQVILFALNIEQNHYYPVEKNNTHTDQPLILSISKYILLHFPNEKLLTSNLQFCINLSQQILYIINHLQQNHIKIETIIKQLQSYNNSQMQILIAKAIIYILENINDILPTNQPEFSLSHSQIRTNTISQETDQDHNYSIIFLPLYVQNKNLRYLIRKTLEHEPNLHIILHPLHHYNPNQKQFNYHNIILDIQEIKVISNDLKPTLQTLQSKKLYEAHTPYQQIDYIINLILESDHKDNFLILVDDLNLSDLMHKKLDYQKITHKYTRYCSYKDLNFVKLIQNINHILQHDFNLSKILTILKHPNYTQFNQQIISDIEKDTIRKNYIHNYQDLLSKTKNPVHSEFLQFFINNINDFQGLTISITPDPESYKTLCNSYKKLLSDLLKLNDKEYYIFQNIFYQIDKNWNESQAIINSLPTFFDVIEYQIYSLQHIEILEQKYNKQENKIFIAPSSHLELYNTSNIIFINIIDIIAKNTCDHYWIQKYLNLSSLKEIKSNYLRYFFNLLNNSSQHNILITQSTHNLEKNTDSTNKTTHKLSNYQHIPEPIYSNQSKPNSDPFPPNYVVPVEIRPQTLAATNIEKLINNPYAFYANKILKLKKIEEIEKSFSMKDFGTLIHNILEKFVISFPFIIAEFTEYILSLYKILPPINLKFINQKYQNELYKFIEEKFMQSSQDIISKSNIGNNNLSFWYPKIRFIAQNFIPNEINFWIQHNNTIIMTEKKFLRNIKINNNADIAKEYTINARIDRIEIHDNNLSIVDYKAGSIPSKNSINNHQSLQLNIAAWIIMHPDNIQSICLQTSNIRVLNLHKIEYKAIQGIIRPNNPTQIEVPLENILEQTQEILGKILSHFNHPNTSYTAYPSTNDYNEYAHLAREFDWN